jgi:hypothetical protein
MATHPVRQQEVSAIVLGIPVVPAVGPVRIAVPFLDRALVGSEGFSQLLATGAVFIGLKSDVEPM